MSPKLLTLLSIALVIFSGCQKDIQQQTLSANSSTNSNSINEGTLDSTGRWYGTFKDASSDPDKPIDTVSESRIIRSGIATCDDLALFQCELSSIGYYLPADRQIAGDSITFMTTVLDKPGTVQLDIIGTKNIAHVQCRKIKGDTTTVTLSVGTAHITSAITPAINFSTFRKVSLVVKENKAVFVIGNEGKIALQFANANKIGMVKILSTGYDDQPQIYGYDNGVIECAGVHLYNSYSKKLLMKEAFSITGKSHTVFY